MAMSRSKGAYSTGYFGPLTGTSPYAKTGGEIFQYVSNGSNPNDIVGATYRTHVFDSIGPNMIHFERDGYVDLVIVAGGAAGGSAYNVSAGGGGGAGGLIQQYGFAVQAGGYLVEVGRGGQGFYSTNTSTESGKGFGRDSSFAGLKAFGGGTGSSHAEDAQSGGSGGGASELSGAGGGSGILGQGFPGGGNNGLSNSGAGGGGAGEAGSDVGPSQPGHGGDGLAIAFYSNEAIYYAGGGAGSQYSTYTAPPLGGLGGGANGAQTSNRSPGPHATFYGGGGAGATRSTTSYYPGGNGYQGIVMVRYRIAQENYGNYQS